MDKKKVKISGGVLSAKQGTVFFDFNGVTERVANLSNIEARLNKNKEEYFAIGDMMAKHKTTGVSGTGSATFRFNNSTMRALMKQLKESGKDFWFDIQITNEDTDTKVGRQVIVLKDCNIDSVLLAKIDMAGGILDDDYAFTFEEWEIREPFAPLNGVYEVSNPIEEILESEANL